MEPSCPQEEFQLGSPARRTAAYLDDQAYQLGSSKLLATISRQAQVSDAHRRDSQMTQALTKSTLRPYTTPQSRWPGIRTSQFPRVSRTSIRETIATHIPAVETASCSEPLAIKTLSEVKESLTQLHRHRTSQSAGCCPSCWPGKEPTSSPTNRRRYRGQCRLTWVTALYRSIAVALE